MTAKKKKPTFEEKYGLQGKGKKVRISKQTTESVEKELNESKRLIEAGENWAKNFKGTF